MCGLVHVVWYMVHGTWFSNKWGRYLPIYIDGRRGRRRAADSRKITVSFEFAHFWPHRGNREASLSTTCRCSEPRIALRETVERRLQCVLSCWCSFRRCSLGPSSSQSFQCSAQSFPALGTRRCLFILASLLLPFLQLSSPTHKATMGNQLSLSPDQVQEMKVQFNCEYLGLLFGFVSVLLCGVKIAV